MYLMIMVIVLYDGIESKSANGRIKQETESGSVLIAICLQSAKSQMGQSLCAKVC